MRIVRDDMSCVNNPKPEDPRSCAHGAPACCCIKNWIFKLDGYENGI